MCGKGKLHSVLASNLILTSIQGGADTSLGKVNILLQSYISREILDDFALISDMAYVAQNGGRIIRALLEIAISNKWANVTAVLMGMSKAIEKRLWPFDQPLKQFDLKADIFYGLGKWAGHYSVAELASMSAAELGELVHMNEGHGAAIQNAAKQFPTVQIGYDLRPLGSDVLKIVVTITRAFNWNSKFHGSAEPFWIWVEDHDGVTILQLLHLLFRQNTQLVEADFVISVPEGAPPPSITIRFVSDRWMCAEDEILVPLESLVMPAPSSSHTPRLDLPFLPLSVLHTPIIENIFSSRLRSFNAIQTQIVWSLLQTRLHALVCAPTGSGKSVVGQLVIWYEPLRSDVIHGLTGIYRMTITKASSNSWVLVVAPRKSVAADLISELRLVSEALDIVVEIPTGQRILTSPEQKTIRVVTAAHLLDILSVQNVKLRLTGLHLVVCENLEQLHPAYELGISLLRHATQSHSTRFVGFANSLNDPADLAAWLDVDALALHSFRPSDRDQSLMLSIQTFTIPQSAALFKAMTKPAYAVIRSVAVNDSTIIFVPSRGQTRLVAQDLVTQCALDMEIETGFLPIGIAGAHMEDYLGRLRDQSLVDFVSRGVGFFHDGIPKPDRNLMLELYAEGILRVLVVPRDSCWTLPVRAATVVVMGTQYMHVEGPGADPQLRDYELTELVRMQSRAVRHSGSGNFHLFCQAEAKDTFRRFLNDGLPLESQLLDIHDLQTWYHKRVQGGGIVGKQQAVDILSFTFLARRLVNNPTYYDATAGSLDENLSWIVDKLHEKISS